MTVKLLVYAVYIVVHLFQTVNYPIFPWVICNSVRIETPVFVSFFKIWGKMEVSRILKSFYRVDMLQVIPAWNSTCGYCESIKIMILNGVL